MNTDKNKKKVVEILSIKHGNVIAESVYNKKDCQSFFCVKREGKMDTKKSLPIDDMVYKPISGHNKLLEDRVILLPSEVGNYESDSALLKRVQEYIHRYVAVSPEYENIVAHYVLLTWVYDFFSEVPYLRVLGNPGSGKTRFLEVVGSICYKATFAGGSTTSASILRIVDQVRGTMVLDEANYAFSDMTTPIAQILNQGYSRRFPVMRVDGKNGIFNPKSFWVYGPKLLATRERFQDDALESRCLSEVVVGTGARNEVPTTLPDCFEKEALELRNMLLAYRFSFTKEVLSKSRLAISEDVHPRIRQVFFPLMNIAPTMQEQSFLVNAAFSHHRRVIETFKETDEYVVLSALLELQKKKDKPTVHEIAHHCGLGIHSKAIGQILRRKLHLKTHRTGNGYIVPILGNENALKEAQRRFEIKNEQNEGSELTK